ncbi:MAG TPA: NAD-dependent epimerase/dehydratase family protein [Acidimicrobiales bacterium]|nr:NAD-dependent epimerase/dehydratase family protein [Acidimicrobiales bacterium]
MRALVTGGAGFIGSNLVDRLLAEGHQVDVVDDLSSGSLANLAEARRSPNGRLTFHQLDVRSPALADLMQRCRPDVVYHLAAPLATADPLGGADGHVMGSVRVLEGARLSGAQKVVFSSGAGIYGDPDPADLPLRESHLQRPVALEGVAKKAVADYLFAYRELYNLEFTALVLAHVYGPRQLPGHESAVVAAFAEHLVAGEPCVIHGTGGSTRDFVFVDDVVDALARAAERGGGLLINVGTGHETAIRDLYRAMAGTAGRDAPAVRAPGRPGDVRRMALDPGRAAIHLGWKPWTTLAVGTAAVLEWRQETGLTESRGRVHGPTSAES